jgi:hypothetical protein
MGKIYLIEANSDGYVTYKIGKTSRSTKKRLNELSTGNSGKLTIIFEYETSNVHILEKVLHRQFSHCHLNGEWFSEDLDITTFINTCQIFDRALKNIA